MKIVSTQEKFIYGNHWVVKHKFKIEDTNQLVGWTFKNPHTNEYETTRIHSDRKGYDEAVFKTFREAKRWILQ